MKKGNNCRQTERHIFSCIYASKVVGHTIVHPSKEVQSYSLLTVSRFCKLL